MKQLLKYVRYLKAHKVSLGFGVLFSVLYGAGSGFGIPAVIEKVFTRVFEEPEQYELSQIIWIALALIGVMVVRGVAGFAGGYLLCLSALKVTVSLRQDIFNKIQSLPLSYFEKDKTGDLITKVNSDTTAVQNLLVFSAEEAAKQPFQIVFGLGFLIYKSLEHRESSAMIALVLMIPLCVLPVRLVAKKLRARGRQLQESEAGVTQQLTENLGALQEVRSFNLEETQKARFATRLLFNRNTAVKLKKYELIQQPTVEVIVIAGLCGIFVYAFQQGVGFSTFSALGIAMYLTIEPLKKILKLLNWVNRYQGPMERISELLEQPLVIEEAKDPVRVERLKGSIAFRDVGFAYQNESVLSGINVAIEPGSVVALVGPSGAGKSTFAKLIPRFYDVKSGAIEIDGIDIRKMALTDLRRNIAVVSQHPVLFDATLFENIRLGRPEATRDEVYAAAKNAYAHEFIEALEDGYETMAGERGERLSGGQRQRVALARAFLKDAPIVVLDEATSALDTESEYYVKLAVEELKKNKTFIIIAHRLSTIRSAGQILVFHQGRIVERGTHEALMERPGVYRDLHEKQAF